MPELWAEAGTVEIERNLKLYWANVLQLKGIGYGYTVHQKNLRAALERMGVEIVEDKEHADVAITIIPAGNYERVKKKTGDMFNVLYTMYECVEIPNSWIPKVNDADLIVVPSSQNERLFKKYTDKPIHICWEGVDVERFVYKKREKSFPFTYLWVGASNERKGYVHTIVAWGKFMNEYPEIGNKCRLIMKTTQLTDNQERIIGYKDGKAIYQKMPRERIFTADNAVVDTRDLPVDQLAGLYHTAHCFLFPTMGEGFGLTLAEAMATGLPCIYTGWGGQVDFISGKEGYPLKFTMAGIKAMTPTPEGWRVDLATKAASADVDHLVRRMVQVYEDYDTALEKGKRAAERIRKDITWDKSAQRFMEIVQEGYSQWMQR